MRTIMMILLITRGGKLKMHFKFHNFCREAVAFVTKGRLENVCLGSVTRKWWVSFDKVDFWSKFPYLRTH